MRRLARISSEDDKIELLEQLLELNPTMLQLKEKRVDIRRQLDTLQKKKGTRRHFGERGIFDIPSSRSSYDVSMLTGSDVHMRLVYFMLTGEDTILDVSLHRPHMSTIKYKDIPFQMIALPPVFAGDHELTPDKYRLLRRMDQVILVVESPTEYETLRREVSRSGLDLYSPINQPNGNEETQIMVPSFVVQSGDGMIDSDLIVSRNPEEEEMLEEMYRHLGIARVYTRPGEDPTKPPIIFDRNEEISVRRVAEDLGDRFTRNFRYAKVWDHSGELRLENALLDYPLNDGDMVRFYLR